MPDVDEQVANGPPSPYKGLVPYSDEDAPYFFGRDHERQVITDNLQAARLTLIYGESGVGKTSVLRAGVVHLLRRQAQEAQRRRLRAHEAGDADAEIEKPRFVVVEFATWRDDPLNELPAAIEASARLIYGDGTPAPPPPTRRLDELLQGWAERLGADLLLIFDQFEEYLLYHAGEEGDGTFGTELARAIGREDLRANFLVAIREDSLAKLDRFKGRINFLNNYYRVRHLDRAAARDAIQKPIERYNTAVSEAGAMRIEPGLVDRVLQDVAHGQVVVGAVGQGTVAVDDQPEDRIEAPYLQLVMDRLWREERSRGSSVLRVATLDELGGAQRIVRTHLDNAMADLTPERRDLAARVFRFLVTPGGSKIALSGADLAEFADVPEAALTEVLEDLAMSQTRILRAVMPPLGETEARYEIYHDVLAPAILDWRTRYEEERRRIKAEDGIKRESEARVAAVRRRAVRFALLVVLLLAVAGGGFALQTQAAQAQAEAAARAEVLANEASLAQTRAELAQTRAESAAHVAQAISELDPQVSLAHALRAWDIMDQAGLPPSSSAEAALRLALSHSHLAGMVREHTDIVWQAAYNRDGSRIVTASKDGSARIVDAATSQTLHVLKASSDVVVDALFTPDNRRVVTTGEGAVADVWDAETGQIVWNLSHGQGAPSLARTATVNGAGKYFATGAFTADGRYLVTSAGHSAWIWDLTTGVLVREIKDPDANAVYSATFSPDGKRVLTAGYGGIARMWDVATGKRLGEEMDNITAWVTAATFSPNGKLIACANQDGSIGLWSGSTGANLDFRDDHTGQTQTVTFSADGNYLLSAGGKTAVVIDVSLVAEGDEEGSSEVRTEIPQQASWIDSAEFSPDGHYVVTANQDGTARVSDSATGVEMFALRGHEDIVWTATFRPDGKEVVTASEDGTARLWTVDTGRVLRGHDLPVTTARFSPDGSRLVTPSWDETASVWDPATGGRTGRLEGTVRDFGKWPIGSAQFVGDSKNVLTSQADGTVAFWDASSGKQTRTCCVLKDTSGGSWAPSWAETVPGHEDRAIVLYEDSSVHVWDLRSGSGGSDIRAFEEGGVMAFAVSADGASIVTVGRDDKKARVWRADWDKNTFTEAGGWSSELVSNLEFSPDGDHVVMGGLDGVVRIWDVSTGKQVVRERDDELRIAAGAVSVVAYNSDGSWILAGSSDGVVRIWDAANAAFLADIKVQGASVNGIDTTSSGLIATASDDRSATVFVCEICGPVDEVVELARAQAALTPIDVTK